MPPCSAKKNHCIYLGLRILFNLLDCFLKNFYNEHVLVTKQCISYKIEKGKMPYVTPKSYLLCNLSIDKC